MGTGGEGAIPGALENWHFFKSPMGEEEGVGGGGAGGGAGEVHLAWQARGRRGEEGWTPVAGAFTLPFFLTTIHTSHLALPPIQLGDSFHFPWSPVNLCCSACLFSQLEKFGNKRLYMLLLPWVT